jgi:hypothetical protein
VSNRHLQSGLLALASGLLASSLSSFLERFPLLGGSTQAARGFLEGLSVVAFAFAIFSLVRSRRIS